MPIIRSNDPIVPGVGPYSIGNASFRPRAIFPPRRGHPIIRTEARIATDIAKPVKFEIMQPADVGAITSSNQAPRRGSYLRSLPGEAVLVIVGASRWPAWAARARAKIRKPRWTAPVKPTSCTRQLFFATFKSLKRPVLLSNWGRSAADLGWTPEYLRQQWWQSTVRLSTYAVTAREPPVIFLTNSAVAKKVSTEIVDTSHALGIVLGPPNARFAYRTGMRIAQLPAALREVLPVCERWEDAALWFQSPRVVTPFHYDTEPGLLHQLQGEKRVLMYPSFLGYKYLDAYSAFALEGCHTSKIGSASAIDHRELRLIRSAPGAAGAPYDFILYPGQTLYIPPFWWHHVEALTASISMVARTSLSGSARMHPMYARVQLESFLVYLRDRNADNVK